MPTNTSQTQPATDTSPARQLSLTKAGQEYRFKYDAGDERSVLDALVELVNDTSADLDWFDAAVLSHQLGERMADELGSLLQKNAA